MKKIAIIAASMLLSAVAFAQDGKQIYNKYSDERNVSAVYISPAMFKMIGKLPDMEIADDDINLTQTVNSLTGFYLIDSENLSVNGNLKRDVERFVKSGNYEMLMEVKDDGEKVNIYTIGKGDELTSLVFLASESDECTFISLEGKMSRAQVEKILMDASK